MSKPATQIYSSRLLKGGAMLDDMRTLVRYWSENTKRETVIRDNLLGKRSKRRVNDVVNLIFSPRFLYGDPPNAWKIVRPLEDNVSTLEVLKTVYYWISCRSERILYDFTQQVLLPKYHSPDLSVRFDETVNWIRMAALKNKLEWSVSVIERIAWGLMAALRDFGVLEGIRNKKIASIYIPIEAFAYIAFVLQQLGHSAAKLVQHADWQLFFLSPQRVEQFFLEAHREKFLNFAAAGNIYRVEFPVESVEEMANVITQKTF